MGVGGELVPCDMPDERSVALRNTVADPDYVAADASRDRLDLLHETGALELGLDAADTVRGPEQPGADAGPSTGAHCTARA